MSNFQIALVLVFIVLLLVGVLIFAGVLPGFRGNSGGVVGSVTMWGPLPSSALDGVVTEFNRAYQGQVTLAYTAKDPARYESELLEALASLAGPDLFLLPDDWVVRHADKILPAPYTKEFSLRQIGDDYIEQTGLFLRSSGLLAFPLYLDPLVLYYNKDLLSAAGLVAPPTTWTKLKLDAEVLTNRDERRNILQSAVALGQFANINSAKAVLEALLFQAGDPIVRVDGGTPRVVLKETFGFASPPAARVVDFFNQFSNPSSATYTWNRSLPEALTAFASGRLAYYFGPASDLEKIRVRNPHLAFDVALLPQKDDGPKITSGRLMGVAVSQQTRGAAAALFAAAALARPEFAGELVGRLSLPPARRDLLSAGTADPILDVFYRSALISRGWLDPNPSQSTLIFRDMIESVSTGRLPATEAVAAAHDQLASLYR